MSLQIKLEVRCCCEPKKLLGWVYVNPNWINDKTKTIRFITSTIKSSWIYRHEEENYSNMEFIELPLSMIYMWNGERYLAVKAEGVPMRELKKIEGFRENTAT